jgi:carbon monoxide dehydrogenase subunit G
MSGADLIPIAERVSIDAPPAEVWPLLADPATVVACVPGAALVAQRPDGTYEATISVRFGPTIARFSGEVTVAYDHAARRCNVEGRGIDQRGASRALVSLLVAVEGTERSELSVDGGFSVAGPLETFASAGGVHVARALLGQFAANVAERVAARRAAPTPASAPAQAQTQAAPPALVAELRGGQLLWTALRGWLRSLFAGRRE